MDLKAQSMFSSGGISGNGELWIVEAEQKPVKPQKDVKLQYGRASPCVVPTRLDSYEADRSNARVAKQALRPEPRIWI
ncbi:MAG: hypothetical protein R3C02_00935 [Planctomycetaceae bacterium]